MASGVNLALKLPLRSVSAVIVRVMPLVCTSTSTFTARSGRLLSALKAVPVISMGVPAWAMTVSVCTVA